MSGPAMSASIKPFANPLLCALDTGDLEAATGLARALSGIAGGVKVGMELFYAHGPGGYRKVADAGLPVFLDLKLHDIPNTVAGAIRSLGPLSPAMITVHAGGGPAMLRAAAEAARALGRSRPLVVAVTVLTSLDAADLAATGVGGDAGGQAIRLAALAREAGLDGVVCSAHEIERIRAACGEEFKLVVPGIRPEGATAGDQKRVMTPREALERGADLLVVGRPITAAADPSGAARAIAATLDRTTPSAG